MKNLAQAFEALPAHLQPSKDQAVHMRWILSWKLQDGGTAKPKARAVLLGYQDPGYAHRATTAPVMSRQTRQLLLQLAANNRWRVAKGDVTGAFLQGREFPDVLYCVPSRNMSCNGHPGGDRSLGSSTQRTAWHKPLLNGTSL